MARQMEFRSREARESAYRLVMNEQRRERPGQSAAQLERRFLARLEYLTDRPELFEKVLATEAARAAREPYEAAVRKEHPDWPDHRVMSEGRKRMRRDADEAERARKGSR
jgi:hypothetical protein